MAERKNTLPYDLKIKVVQDSKIEAIRDTAKAQELVRGCESDQDLILLRKKGNGKLARKRLDANTKFIFRRIDTALNCLSEATGALENAAELERDISYILPKRS
jgi:hypothetical protein